MEKDLYKGLKLGKFRPHKIGLQVFYFLNAQAGNKVYGMEG
jgi:hypothetical protein